MARLVIKCKTASTVLDGVEIKPSITLIESTIYLEPNKIPTEASIKALKEQYSNTAVQFALPAGEICTCEIDIVE
ncbi:hypothetical protein [Mesoflavibacter profundi]|uniref:hypothetical protein n=1 Tax=Mesoflavibacter profundi TaxID=2708110 RepID=UPI00168BF037|nr:hypothetical protein [Mesoflavibacter profundi]